VAKSQFSFPQFRALLERVDSERVDTFAAIEHDFLGAMSAFDRRVAAGDFTSGENQNKGLFFNELIARLVERCAGFGVAQRGKRPGILLPQVGLHVQCSTDAGHTFTQIANGYDTSPVGLAASQGGSRTGNLVFDPSNPSYMYTVFAYENIEDGPNPNAFLHNVGVAVSSDGGVTWHDYPVKINPDITAKYDNQFVNVAVDKSGVVYVAYSDNHGIFYQYSTNRGQTFSAPVQVSQGADTAVMPWLAAGERGKIDLVYYQAVGYSGNPEVAGASVPWKVVMAQSLAAASPLPAFSYTTVNPVVHHGGVCEGGALCTGNRDLYDDFGVEASPTTGFASIVYSDDQYQNDANHKPNATFNCTAADSDSSTCDHTNVATQTAGTRLFTVKGK